MEKEPKIVKAEIKSLPFRENQVHAVFDNGEEKKLFSYDRGEIWFSAGEFVGLTNYEAQALHTKRDIEFLRS